MAPSSNPDVPAPAVPMQADPADWLSTNTCASSDSQKHSVAPNFDPHQISPDSARFLDGGF